MKVLRKVQCVYKCTIRICIIELNNKYCTSCLFQVLVALACDLGLDSLPTCLEAHKWSWFRRYCMAARVAKSLESRSSLSAPFCEDVMKKIQEISAEGETLNRDHEDHNLFGREQDEQLLLWLNRCAFV